MNVFEKSFFYLNNTPKVRVSKKYKFQKGYANLSKACCYIKVNQKKTLIHFFPRTSSFVFTHSSASKNAIKKMCTRASNKLKKIDN